MKRVLGLIILGFGSCLGIEWELGPIERVDDDTGKARKYYPVLAVTPDGFCVAVWEDGRPGHTQPFCSLRPPEGKWSTNEKVNKEPTKVNPYPSVAISRNHTIYVAWNARYGDSNTDIFVSYKVPGDTFSDPVNITNTPSKCEWAPILATDTKNNLYCIWSRTDGLYFSYCPKGGEWSEEETITDAPTSLPGGSITIDNQGIVYAVWDDTRNFSRYLEDIYFSFRSKDGIWSTNERLNNDTGLIWQGFPEIGADGMGNLHCLYQDTLPGGSPYIYKPVGEEWSEPIRLGSDYVGVYSLVVDEDGNAYALMGRFATLLYRPFGGEWREANIQFADDSALIGKASLKVDNKKNLCCVWDDSRYGYDIILFRIAKNVEGMKEKKIDKKRKFYLSEPIPNPIRNFTNIKYQLSSKGYITLKVYDVSGRLVRTLLDKECNEGVSEILWDVKDDTGEKVSAGVYFLGLEVKKEGGDKAKIRKVVVVR